VEVTSPSPDIRKGSPEPEGKELPDRDAMLLMGHGIEVRLRGAIV
jgi:hypothetical protein